MSEATDTLQRLPELAGQFYNEKKFGFDRILVATELPADLLVLSTRGLTGWKHFLLGSYAEKILEHARTLSDRNREVEGI